MLGGLGTIGAGLGLAGALFGGNKGGNPGGSQSGYAALPKEAQQAWQQYFGMVNQLGQNPGQLGPTPFNQFQQNALNSFGNPDFSQEGLQNYLAPFQGLRDRQLGQANRDFDTSDARLASMFRSGAGKGEFNGGRMNALNDNAVRRNESLSGINSGFDMNALGLQRQSLQDQLMAGNQMQNLQEQGSPFGLAQRYNQLVQGFPQSQTSWGASQGSPNFLSQLGGLGMFIGSQPGQDYFSQWNKMFSGGAGGGMNNPNWGMY